MKLAVLAAGLVLAVSVVDAGVATPGAPAIATGPPTKTLRGSGSRVLTIRLGTSRPLVVTAAHSGSANFIVRLVSGAGTEYLFNEIGSYRGQAAVAEIKPGRFRVAVEADGSWTLSFKQPIPTSHAKVLPGSISGGGAKVIQVRTRRDLQPIVRATHNGQANFIVQMIGYGNLSGTEYLFNEIGRYAGETLTELPAGHYLLYVQADGSWSLKFIP